MTIPYYSPATSPVNAHGVVVTDVACRKCAYDLRSLSVNGRCPECGTPVGLSIQGDLLRYADPAWLEKLRRGIHFIFAGLIFGLVAGGGAAIIYAALGRQEQVAGHVTGFISGVISAIGLWLLTEPDPSGLGEEQYGRARVVVRAAVIFGLSQHVLQIALAALSLPSAVALLLGILAVAGMVFEVVAYVAQLSYLERLVRRIPDPKLAGQFHFLMYAIGICYAILALVGAGIIAFMGVGVFAGRAPAALPGGGGPGTTGALIAVGCAAAVAGLASFAFYIVYLIRLGQLSGRLRDQATTARYIWSAAANAPTTGPAPMVAAAVAVPSPSPEAPAPKPVPPPQAH